MQEAPAWLADFFYQPDEPVSGWLTAITNEALAAQRAVAFTAKQFLSFELRSENFVLPIHLVREIHRIPRLTEVPRGPPGLLGVFGLRERVLPAYDLAFLLNLKSQPDTLSIEPDATGRKAARLLVVGESEDFVSLLVDHVHGVNTFSDTEWIDNRTPSVRREAVVGMFRRGQDLFQLLDYEKALRA